MTRTTQRLRLWKIAAFVTGVAAIGGLLFLFLNGTVVDRDIPLPFGLGTALHGDVTDIGMKGGKRVVHVSFDDDEMAEELRFGALNIILTPDSPTISHGASLCDAIPAQTRKKYYGYKYTSSDATAERIARDEAINTGVPSPLSVLFPGEFFASIERLAETDVLDLRSFERTNEIMFTDPCDVTLEKNARYVVITDDEDTVFTARGLSWCGDRIIDTSRSEECDDGNSVNADGCNVSCDIEPGYVCTGSPSVCHQPVCGDGITEGFETCNDGNTQDRDGCSAECQSTVLWSAQIQGPGTWDAASFTCSELVDGGRTGWRLPTIAEWATLASELARADIMTRTWTSTRAPGSIIGREPDVWMVVDMFSGNTFEAEDFNIHFGLCVAPERNAFVCEDSDNTPDDANVFEQNKESIYEAGSIRAIAGPESDVTYVDECFSPGSLREYFCLGGQEALSRRIYCPDGYGCVNGACNRELPAGQSVIPPPQCQDGIDNDGDGVMDFNQSSPDFGDPGCEDEFEDDESRRTTACQDGLDNDGDGLVDEVDPGCWSRTDRNEAHIYDEPIVLNSVAISSCGLHGTTLHVDFASNIDATCARMKIVKPDGGIQSVLDSPCYYGLVPMSVTDSDMDPALLEAFQTDVAVKLCHGNDSTICSEVVTMQRELCPL